VVLEKTRTWFEVLKGHEMVAVAYYKFESVAPTGTT